MTRKPVSRVAGSVHDIETLKGLGTEPAYVRLFSAQALYILQNYATLDVGFTSRYGTMLGDGYYAPVDMDSTDGDTVLGAIDLVRMELSMTQLDEALQAIAVAIAQCNSGACSCGGGGGSGCPEGTGTILDPSGESTPPAFGAGTPWTNEGEFYDDKCHVANLLYQQYVELLTKLNAFNVDSLLAGGVALAVATVAATIAASIAVAPVALVLTVVSGIVALMAGNAGFSLDDVIDRFTTDKNDFICALYNSSNADEAVTDAIDVIDDGTLSSFELAMLGFLIRSAATNQLFTTPLGLLAMPITSPYDCSSCTGVYAFRFGNTPDGDPGGSVTAGTLASGTFTADAVYSSSPVAGYYLRLNRTTWGGTYGGFELNVVSTGWTATLVKHWQWRSVGGSWTNDTSKGTSTGVVLASTSALDLFCTDPWSIQVICTPA